MQNQGRINKRKGSNAERYYAKVFRDLGYTHCKTSRYGSRLHDDAGIDLINVPLNIQIKAGIQKGLNIIKTLEDIDTRVKELFPDTAVEQKLPKILIHKRETGRGSKRNEYHEMVFMTFSDFVKILTRTT